MKRIILLLILISGVLLSGCILDQKYELRWQDNIRSDQLAINQAMIDEGLVAAQSGVSEGQTVSRS